MLKLVKMWGSLPLQIKVNSEDFRVSFLREIQKSSGCVPGQQAVGGPAWTGVYDKKNSQGPSNLSQFLILLFLQFFNHC